MANKIQSLPIFKKHSQNDPGFLDLSVPAAENKALDIYNNSLRATSLLEDAPSSHRRSTSGGSSSLKPPVLGQQYIHPMRQSPSRQQTPDNEIAVVDDLRPPSHAGSGLGEPYNRRPSINSMRNNNNNSKHDAVLQSLDTQAESSHFPKRLFEGSSKNTDPTSPISRSSIEHALRSRSRSRGNSKTSDPAARTAAVLAARQAFEEKEAAKLLKHEQQTLRAQDKESRRRERREHLQHWMKRPSMSDLTSRLNEKDDDPTDTDVNNNESRSNGNNNRHWFTSDAGETAGADPALRSPKSAWMLFLTWLRTRIFKMRRRIRKVF